MTSELNLAEAAFITRPLSQGLAAVGVGVCELDGEGRVEWLSHHAAKLFDTTTEAAVGQDLAGLMARSERSALPLRLVATGLSLKKIAAQLHLSEKTVGTYRSRLATKLGCSSNVELTRLALLNGLVD